MNRKRSLIIIGDFGKDMDDENTLILSDGVNRHQFVTTEGSRKQELFEMLAVVANLAPALERGRLAKGTLKQLGHPKVPVGVGTDCGLSNKGHDHEFINIPYMADADEVEPGADLLVRSLENCDDGTAVLLLISGLTDTKVLLETHADLVKRKAAVVAIMGGVEQENNQVKLDTDGYMIPDSAANNAFDKDAAKYVYRRFQELAIPMVILTREAAYGAPVPRELYDRMAQTGHPVGVKLKESQERAIEDLWRRANLAGDDAARNKLPARCDKEWFCNTFCGGKGKERSGCDKIWDLIVCFQLYDPMTLIAAIPELAEKFYEPVLVTVGGVEHKIIGISKAKNGIKDAIGLADYMTNCFLRSLLDNHKPQKLPKPGDDEKPANRTEEPPEQPPRHQHGDEVSGKGGQMNWDVLRPGYRVTIDTPAKARLYNRILIAKIAVQLIILGGLLALSGWNWQMLLGIAAVAGVWQFFSWRRKRG